MVYFGRTCQLLTFLYLVTFVIILPLLCYHQVFTVYFSESSQNIEETVLRENDQRLQTAKEYFKGVNPNVSYAFHHEKLSNEHLKIVVVLVTVRREKNFHFPIQVAAELHKQIVENPQLKIALLICNADRDPSLHSDALFLSNFFPTVVKKKISTKETYEKEKEDYAFCLEKGLEVKSKFTLILEDDALPRESSIRYLKYILENKIEHKIHRAELIPNPENYIAVKLFYPVRWLGFGFEVAKIIELISIGFVGCGLFCACLIFIWWYYNVVYYNLRTLYAVAFFGGLYLIIFALVIERPNLLELSWVHPSFFRVSPSRGCCTPAVIYLNSHVQRLISYLNQTSCSKEFAVDLAIEAYGRKQNLSMYLIEPNLFRHIGFYSGLISDTKSDLYEFLFD